MASVPGFPRLGFGAAPLLALGLLAAPAVAADRISARVEVYGLMGLHVLTLHTQLEEAADRYAITVDYATTGVAGLVVDQSTRSQTRGRVTPVYAQPDSFRSDTRRNGDERHNRVDYRPDGSLDANSTPPPPDPITPEAARGTVDNLTAYFRLERQLIAKKTCAMTVPVFDGRHRYDLVFEDAGQEVLSPDGGQKWEGNAIACRMTRNIRGIPDGEEGEGARRGTIWYAPLLPGDVMVPVRMQLKTQIGTVDAYLAEVHGRGVDLQLME
jgi:Protein of unknown function (DUF3108)